MTTAVKTNNDQKPARKLRFQALYHEIRERISLLQYPPGTALRESALADEFGVSRTPIRRALHRLEFDGLVHISRGTGAVVAAVDIKSLKEVYALRLKLAEIIGDLNPAHLLQENLAALEDILKQAEQMHDQYDPIALSRLYNTFNQEMLDIIGNEPLKQISEQLFHRTARVWLQLLPDLSWEEEINFMCEEIGDVLVGLRAGDMHTVAQVRRNHMAMLLQRINDYLGSANTTR